MCSVTPAFMAKAWNHSRNSSVSNSPILARDEVDLEHQKRPAGNVDRDAGQRLVHRQVDVGVARDALHVAERLLHRLAERDADILGRVVVIDVQVALGPHRDVDQRVARQLVEHVVEKADAGRDRRRAAAVEVDRDGDVGFLGLARRRCALRIAKSLFRAPFIRGWPGFATLPRLRPRLQ